VQWVMYSCAVSHVFVCSESCIRVQWVMYSCAVSHVFVAGGIDFVSFYDFYIWFWCLMPLSTIFQLYCGAQLYWWISGETHQPVASHWQTLSYNVVHLTLIEIRAHNNVPTVWYFLFCFVFLHFMVTNTCSICSICNVY